MSTGSERLDGVQATHDLAARVVVDLRPGQVIGLVGDLGAGKTEFTRGLVAALGLAGEQSVCSPSYLLLNVYDGGRLPVAHFDAYFMDGPDDLERAGLDDLRRSGHVVVVEWADRVVDVLPHDTLWIQLEAGDLPDERRALFCAPAEAERP